MPKDKKIVHFGYFLRQRRESLGLQISDVANGADMTERQIMRIEQQAKPRSFGATLTRIGVVLRMTLEEMRETWKTTPVAVPSFKKVDPMTRSLTVKLPLDVYSALILKAGGREATTKINRIVCDAIQHAMAGQSKRAIESPTTFGRITPQGDTVDPEAKNGNHPSEAK